MTLARRTKAIFSFLARLAISTVILVVVFKINDIDQMVELLKSADVKYLSYAALLYFVINIFIFFRWLILIRALNLEAKTKTVIRYFFIGALGNLFLPSAIGGDLIKIIGLCHGSKQKPKVVASVILDRLSGFAGIFTVAVIAFIFGFKMINDFSLLISILVLALLSITVMSVLFNERIYTFGCRIFNRLPKIQHSLMTMHYDIALLKGRTGVIVTTVALSCIAQLLLALDFALIARALHQDIGIIYFFIFVPLICVAATVPSIGGLGVREAGSAFLFAKIGVDPAVSVSMSLISFFFMALVGLIGGILYVTTVSPRRVQHNKEGASSSTAQA